MRNWILAVLSTGTLAMLPLFAVEAEIPSLVAALGAETFAEREAAARRLDQLGMPALPALRAARTSLDPEIRRRASLLAEGIEQASLSRPFRQTAPVSIQVASMPLGTAVQEFRAKSKIPVQLLPKGVADPLRPVTVKIEAMPPWEALEAFCKATGLREVFSNEVSLPKPKHPVRNFNFGAQPQPSSDLIPSITAVPVLLTDGSSPSLPAERGGVVRVLALPPRFESNRRILGSGEVQLHLEVAPLPGQNWKDILGVRVRRAIDESGRSVPGSHRIETDLSIPDYSEGNFPMINGRMVMWNGLGEIPQATSAPNPRLVPLTLRTFDRTIHRLKILEGDVQIELEQPLQPLVQVEDLKTAFMTVHDGPNRMKLTVLDMHIDPKRPDQTIIKVKLESPSEYALQQARMQRAWGPGNVLGGMFFIQPSAPTSTPRFEILDAVGKPIPASTSTHHSFTTDDGNTQFVEANITVRNHTPAKLVLIGTRSVTVNVPFHLENVILP